MFSLFKYLKKKDWALVFFCVSLIIIQVWLELKMPDYTRNLTTIIQSGTVTGTASMSEVWKNGGLMMLCALGSLASAILCTFLLARVASSFSKTLRDELYGKISSFSIGEMRKFSVPSLITRTTNDVLHMQNFMAMGIQLIFKAPIMAIWAICKISATNMKWTAAVIICVAVIVICVSTLVALCLPRFKKIQRLTDALNNATRDNVSGVRVIRAFNAESYQEEKFEKENTEITKTHLFTSRTLGLLNPVMTLSMNALTLAIYWIGAILINDIVFSGDMSALIVDRGIVIGNMAAFTSVAMQVVMSFMMLIFIFIILPRTMVSGNRIAEVLKTNPSIIEGNYSPDVSESNSEIEFKNVSFSYSDLSNQELALTNISFKVKKGETLAIIGSTGSGKTTLINLIPRFFDVNSGEVLVDGVNVKEYSEEALNNKISIAAQKAVLFKGTVKDNIIYGTENIDDNKIQKAIEISHSDFISEMENTIMSEVAQGGTNFSGGQKQRMSIARAVYKDAPIMIFDDTFSALDYKTDMLVRKSINEELGNKTIIIVAQRIGTIKDADHILVLDEGKIVGEGKHEELLKTCSVYKEIALSQLSKEEL